MRLSKAARCVSDRHVEETRSILQVFVMSEAITMPLPQHVYGTSGEVLRELEKAREKFPPFHSTHEGYAVLREELDELWDEVKKSKKCMRGTLTICERTRMKAEAIQVAAMALRFAVDLCEEDSR